MLSKSIGAEARKERSELADILGELVGNVPPWDGHGSSEVDLSSGCKRFLLYRGVLKSLRHIWEVYRDQTVIWKQSRFKKKEQQHTQFYLTAIQKSAPSTMPLGLAGTCQTELQGEIVTRGTSVGTNLSAWALNQIQSGKPKAPGCFRHFWPITPHTKCKIVTTFPYKHLLQQH